MNSPNSLSQNEIGKSRDAKFDFTSQEEHKQIQWYPFGDAGFVNAYREVKAHILIRFRIRDSQEFLACVQRDWKPIFGNELQRSFSAVGEAERNVMWTERVLNAISLE
jgi:hypothetical protein